MGSRRGEAFRHGYSEKRREVKSRIAGIYMELKSSNGWMRSKSIEESLDKEFRKTK